MNITTTESLICPSCGLWFGGHPYRVWNSRKKISYVCVKCVMKIRASGDCGIDGLYPARLRQREVDDTIQAMRADRGSWQKIATTLRLHPATVRERGIEMGLPANLPGSTVIISGGWRAHWERIAQADAEPQSNDDGSDEFEDGDRDPLPAGSPATWGAISANPWPGVSRD